jgi:hypothetical protein
MQVTSIEHAIQIQIFKAHLGHHTGIGKNKTLFRLRKNDSKTGLLAWKSFNCGNIGAAFEEPRNAELAKGILADRGMKSHAIAKQRDIVRENGRRTSQRKAQIGSEMLAIQLKMIGKTVQNQIEIELAYNT